MLQRVKVQTTAVVVITVVTALRYEAISLQAWTGPDVSRKLRLPDFKTIST